MRKRQREESSSDSGSWLTTYSDMVTLLLAFFVLMFAFSAVDEEKFSAVMAAFQNYLGVLSEGRNVLDSSAPLPFDYSDMGNQQLQELFEQMSEYIEEQGLTGVELELEERGLIIRFAEQVFFALGEARLKPDALKILDDLAVQLRDLPNPLRVEGHTDDWPIKTSMFPSNWELSVHRATNVVRHLIEEDGFDPEKLSVAGYSEYRPIRANDTVENRAMNRRVDIVILNIDMWSFEPN